MQALLLSRRMCRSTGEPVEDPYKIEIISLRTDGDEQRKYESECQKTKNTSINKSCTSKEGENMTEQWERWEKCRARVKNRCFAWYLRRQVKSRSYSLAMRKYTLRDSHSWFTVFVWKKVATIHYDTLAPHDCDETQFSFSGATYIESNVTSTF